MQKPWIAVDLDGTLAEYNGWVAADHIGKPVQSILYMVKDWLEEGKEVRIFTARISPLNVCLNPKTDIKAIQALSCAPEITSALVAAEAIRKWCLLHVGVVLPITNIKDQMMSVQYDDRAVQVISNTGEIVGRKYSAQTFI